jgi:hypothetical protein
MELHQEIPISKEPEINKGSEIDPKEQIQALNQGYEYWHKKLGEAEFNLSQIKKDSPEFSAAQQKVIDMRTKLINTGMQRKGLEDKAA